MLVLLHDEFVMWGGGADALTKAIFLGVLHQVAVKAITTGDKKEADDLPKSVEGWVAKCKNETEQAKSKKYKPENWHMRNCAFVDWYVDCIVGELALEGGPE